jgi:microcystin-dependent protein
MIKNLLPILLFSISVIVLKAQNGVGINETGSSPDASSILDLASTKAGILIPRMTLAQRNANIGSPATGLLIYQTDSSPGFYYYNGSTWVRVSDAGNGIQSISVNAPLTSTGGQNPTLGITQSNTSTNGFLTSTDWNTFNNKLSTTLTSARIWVGNGSNIAQERTIVQDATLDNVGNLTVKGLQSYPVSNTAPTSNDVLTWNGTAWAPGNRGVPTGVIVMWSGTKTAIPAGWALCDGTSGTPNLLDRFIMSVNISNYTAGDINITGGANSYSLSAAQLPSHNHTGTTDATTATGSFIGTSVTTNTVNTDHTHQWGGVWNIANAATAPTFPSNGDGGGNTFSDGINGVGYWGAGTIQTGNTDVNHFHTWGGTWNTSNSTNDWYIISDGWTWWNQSGSNFVGAWTGWHNHSYSTRGWTSGWGQSYASGSGGWGSGWTDGANGTQLIKHRHYIDTYNTSWSAGGNAQNHSHTIPNHRHWIATNNTGTMSANTSHNHTVIPAGTISINSHSHTFITGNTGTGSAIDNRPAFYRLAYIMKL